MGLIRRRVSNPRLPPQRGQPNSKLNFAARFKDERSLRTFKPPSKYVSTSTPISRRELQGDAPNELIGLIMSTYFGGRAEVHLRRTLCQVLYCDFLSMYPTVCTLMGLWRFVIAKGMR
jgi:hypothetical protein